MTMPIQSHVEKRRDETDKAADHVERPAGGTASRQSSMAVQCRFAGDVAQQVPGGDAVPPNATGMPDTLKHGLERLSGFDLSAVRVHYNSPEPARVGALAYAQGTNIHLGPGQAKHLPHEGWHVVQQMQGRVRPTVQYKKTAINDDAGLEREADLMAVKAMQYTGDSAQQPQAATIRTSQWRSGDNGAIQRVKGIAPGTVVKAMHFGDTPVDGTVVEDRDNEYLIKVSLYDGEEPLPDDYEIMGLDQQGQLVIPERWVEAREAIKTVPHGGVEIVHFTSRGGVEPSEFVDRGTKRIDVTSHGFGTGVYGLAEPSETNMKQAMEHDPRTEIFRVRMRNPLYLQDEAHGQEFTRLSKGLQRLLINMTARSEKGSERPGGKGILVPARRWKEFEAPDNLELRLTVVLRRVGREENVNALITETVRGFFAAYYFGNEDLLEQPINYLMALLGYDGVYADNPSDNRWSRGNVAYGYAPSSSSSGGERIHK